MLRLELEIIAEDGKLADMLSKVLKPDNKPARSQSFTMKKKKNSIYFEISSERMLSCITSARSVLKDVKLFEEIIQGVCE